MKIPNFNNRILLSFYISHKEHIISYVVIVVSLLIFIITVPSQIKNIVLSKKESEEASKRVEILSKNLDFLSKQSDATLDSNLHLVSSALPDTKDFEIILKGISQAGLAAGVQVGDFGLDIGDLSPVYSKGSTISTINMELAIDGGIDGAVRFIQELSNVFPLSEVHKIQSLAGSSRITVGFFFKPFPPAKLEKNTSIQPLSNQENSILDQLSKLSEGKAQQIVLPEESTATSAAKL